CASARAKILIDFSYWVILMGDQPLPTLSKNLSHLSTLASGLRTVIPTSRGHTAFTPPARRRGRRY
ncbi:hypothetical protein L1K69_23565, partial [Salmonella enterica subsp. enterica serovar Anatum]|nr:hypothetical protein [Salmonella enterica subsp. enterica serovar Anatum]